VHAESQRLTVEQRRLVDTLGRQTAMALERAFLAEAADESRARAEREELRSTLLSSVSHDLRTPLAAVTGAATTLLSRHGQADAEHELLETILEEASRLNQLVSNLLDMTKLESGGIVVKKEWTPLEEVIGTALNRLDVELSERPVHVGLPDTLPLIPVDGVLLQQAFFNVLENAAKHTSDGEAIDISAWQDGDAVVVEIADRGPGLPPGSEEQVFDKFYRASGAAARGTGLGLPIARGIVVAHGGTLVGENREGGGAVFRMRLPIEGAAPRLEAELLETEAPYAPTAPGAS
jgi:two-component system sensor histidine kinase KdpD